MFLRSFCVAERWLLCLKCASENGIPSAICRQVNVFVHRMRKTGCVTKTAIRCRVFATKVWQNGANCVDNSRQVPQTKRMIIIFIRAIILFAVLLLAIRLMGKRQIGEMEPFELVITLVISELACIPMADRSIPITFGIVAILTMFVIHQFILLLSKSTKLQEVINGKPVMVITPRGIDVAALKSLNMHVNDVLQALRTSQHFSLEEVTYGIMETNGQLTVVANKSMENKQQTLPVPVALEGKWNTEEIAQHGFSQSALARLLQMENVKLKNVVLLAVDENNRISLQRQGGAIIFKNTEVNLRG